MGRLFQRCNNLTGMLNSTEAEKPILATGGGRCCTELMGLTLTTACSKILWNSSDLMHLFRPPVEVLTSERMMKKVANYTKLERKQIDYIYCVGTMRNEMDRMQYDSDG